MLTIEGGSGLAVGRTLKCERTGFWVGLQIAPLRAVGARCVPFSLRGAYSACRFRPISRRQAM